MMDVDKALTQFSVEILKVEVAHSANTSIMLDTLTASYGVSLVSIYFDLFDSAFVERVI